MSTSEQLLPNYSKLETALRSIGYSFDTAVADIIDNSIDASATHVLVRLVARQSGPLDLVIWDDGIGMDADTLKEAMRFGADVSRDLKRLGKFGLGLKLASLSQARALRVVSAKRGSLSGRAWLEEGIAQQFTSTVFNERECRELIAGAVPDHNFKSSGTLVWWSHLYRVGHQLTNPQQHAQKLMRRLDSSLALAFHRFLSGRPRKIAIRLDIFDHASRKPGIPIDLDALDPFGYGHTGREGFPAPMLVDGAYRDRISVRAHIWPPNSSAAEYKLPGGANNRQGFYFYRNNRLIQGGGWNGIREVEPHSSLARVEIDMASELDLEVSLDVRKVEIQLPPEMAVALQKAKTPSGLDFRKYLSLAEEAYRKRTVTEAELPLIPSSGLPAGLTSYLRGELRLKRTSKYRDLHIAWRRLDDESFFEIDRDEGRLYLNQAYRKSLLHGLSGSSADIPVVKCLLFLLLEEALSSERMGPRIRERLEQMNRILVRAVRYEREAQ
jgi:hypothetical protein